MVAGKEEKIDEEKREDWTKNGINGILLRDGKQERLYSDKIRMKSKVMDVKGCFPSGIKKYFNKVVPNRIVS